MSIGRLIFKQKIVFHIPNSIMQGKCKLSNNSIIVLYYGTLHGVNFRPTGMDLICQKWDLYYVLKLHY